MEPGQYLTPFQHKLLLKSLETDLRPEYRRRIEIMLLADAGQSQTEICKALGCSPEMARYWMDMAQTGRAHLWKERPMGRPKTVNDEYLARLKELVNRSPREYDYPFQRWTAQWLSKHLAKELGIEVSACHINRLLKQMGLSTRSKPATEAAPSQSNLAIRDLTSSPVPELPGEMAGAKS
jgi:transposase